MNKIKEELTTHITEWLRERRAITADQGVTITIDVVPLKPVSVEFGSNPTTIYDGLFNSMGVGGNYLKNSLWNGNIRNLSQLQSASLDTLLGCRNVGRVLLQKLGKICIERKIGCHWAEELQGLTPYHQELEKATVRDMVVGDWSAMICALRKPLRKHTKTQLLLVNRLGGSGNQPVSAYKIFPRNIHSSWWKSILFLMNQRWKNRGLQYRIKFIPDQERELTKFGKVVIAISQF